MDELEDVEWRVDEFALPGAVEHVKDQGPFLGYNDGNRFVFLE